MILSKKTKYALVALTRLAKEYGEGPIPIKDIAESEKIPQSFLENILLELRKMGILGSKLGKAGGYYLLKKPEEVNLAVIIRHFEGTIALMYCVSEKAYQRCEFCRDEEVNLAVIVRHFEGTIALMYCVSEKAYQRCEFCRDEETCGIRKVFKEIRDTTYDILARTTLDSLI